MKFIIFVALFAVQYAHGLTASEHRASVGGAVYLYTDYVENKEDIVECKLETSNGLVYKFMPGEIIVPDTTEYRIYSLDRNSCSVGVQPIKKEDAGMWKLTMTKQELAENEYQFAVYLRRNGGIVPADSIAAREGAIVSALMAAPDSVLNKLTSCSAITPQKEKFDVFNETRENIVPLGKCGVRMTVNANDEGKWTLEAVTNDFLVYTATFTVKVMKANLRVVRDTGFDPIVLTQGEPGKIVVGPSNAKFCRLQTPEFENLPPINGRCSYEIPVVTTRHEGSWFATYAVPGELDTISRIFKVFTRAKTQINGTVEYTLNNTIDLSCSMQTMYPKKLSFCRFTRPDQLMLNADPEISSGKYMTLEKPDMENMDKTLYCGIRITDPETADYGPWRCEIGSGTSKTEVSGTILHVNDHLIVDTGYTAKISAVKVYAKKGDPFRIRCLTDKILDYCWFKSPNGTAYSVSSEGHESLSTLSLPYKGAGLSMGECVAEIDRAEATDDGEWTCYLGLHKGHEVSQVFNVNVVPNYLYGGSPALGIYLGETKPSLSCRIIPQAEDRAVHYCRWIRPDGYGIYNGVSLRYRTTSNKYECRLVILNYIPKEDAGTWTCVAGVMGSQFAEMSANVVVNDASSKGMSGLVLGLVISGCVVLTMLGVVIVLVQLYKRRQRAVRQQPPTYAKPHTEPKSLNPEYGIKEFQY